MRQFPTFIFNRTYQPAFATLLLLYGCCVSCNTDGASSAGSAQTAGVQNMTAVMAETRRKLDHPQNIFNAAAKLAFCDSILAHTDDPKQQIIRKFEKAGYLLENGNEARSVALYEELLNAGGNDPEVRKNVLPALGMAYLRLAERINCLVRHNQDACILPIKGGGIHQDKTPARKAADIFLMVLQDNPNDLDARWLYNIACMTTGDYPAGVQREWLIPGLDAQGTVTVRPFTDVAPGMGLATDDPAGGAIIEDFDNDGYLDIVTSAWNLDAPMHFLRNNGDGSFSDRSRESGLANITGGLNLTHTDYNNDGFMDIFVLRGAWQGFTGFGEQPNSLLRNNGDGTFTDVTIEAGILSFHPTQTATWNDFNNDGWLDVFIGNETYSLDKPQPCELFLNNQNGTFTDVFARNNFIITSFVKGVASGDYDNDGWPDLFISTMDGPKLLLRNLGVSGHNVAFENVSQRAGFSNEHSRTFPTWFFDFDNDGWLDICVWNYDFDQNLSYYAAREALKPSGDMTGKGYLYRNNRDGTFTNISRAANLNQPAFAMGSNFGDIDNDGYLDICLGTGNPNFQSLVPNKLFKNIGGVKFADVTASARVGNLQKGHGVAMGDLDNDGDLDIYINMGGAFTGDAYPSALYQNPGQSRGNWITLKLEGTRSNRPGIGAKITVKFRENGKIRTVYREVNAGGSFGCSPFRQHIGIGSAAVIDEISIIWPASLIRQVFRNIQPNQYLSIREGDDTPHPFSLEKLTFKNLDGSIPMCAPPL